MRNHHALPKALKVDVLPFPGMPVMVRLRVSAVEKNDYYHYALVKVDRGAVVPFSNIVESADEEANAFLMDYKDIRTNFAGSVSGEVVDNSRSLENIVSANVNWTDIRTAMKYVSKVPRGIRVLVTLIS